MTHLYAPECESLAAVAAGARSQLAALQSGEPSQFESAAAQTLDAVADLDRRRQDRARRAGGSDDAPASADDRTALQAAAHDARQACDELAFALEHAVALGRDLIGAWQQMSAPTTAQVYTARGAVGPPTPAGRLHQTG